MSAHSVKIEFDRFSSSSELDKEDKELFDAACHAASTAYAPYSRFAVGAAVLLETGEIVVGSNQENIAYPSGLCAERVALFAAAAQKPKVAIKALAVSVAPLSNDPDLEITPCGACRQVMVEYERIHQRAYKVITGSARGQITVFKNALSLLPLAFFDKGLTGQSV
jgi:cytidine deaminase